MSSAQVFSENLSAASPETMTDLIVDASSVFMQELALLFLVALVPLSWRAMRYYGFIAPEPLKKRTSSVKYIVDPSEGNKCGKAAETPITTAEPRWRANLRAKQEAARQEQEMQQSGMAQRLPPQDAPKPQQKGQQSSQPDWVQAGEKRVLQLLSSKEYMRGLNVFRSLERREPQECSFSEEVFSGLIQASIRVGHIDVVERLLHTMMNRCSASPSLEFWQLTVKMLSSRRHFAACVQVHAKLNGVLPQDKIVYSCLVNAALEMDATSSAVAMMTAYENCDLEPKDYVVVFRTYLAARDAEAAKLRFRKLGHQTTPLMFNLMLLTCVNAGQAEEALQLIDEAKSLQSSQSPGAGVRGAWGEPMVDVVSFNTVMKGFAQLGAWRRCFECIGHMMDCGLQPDDISFGTLLEACISDDALDTASSIIGALTSQGRPLDTVTCTVIIKGLLRSSQLQKALAFYDEMKQREGSKPDIVTYSMLIKASVGDMGRVLSFLEDFREAGHKIDDIILTHVLDACRLAGNRTLGMRFFDDAVAAGVKPSDYTLATLLKLLGSCGDHQRSYELLEGWHARFGFKPTVLHYTCVMSGCLRSRNYDQAWSTYELMCNHGIGADETAVATLMRGLVAARQYDRVIELTRRARRGTPPVNVSSKLLGMAVESATRFGQDVASLDQLQLLMKSCAS